MLTADLAMSWQRGNRVEPRYIKTGDSGYLQTAKDLIAIISQHKGNRRAELDRALEEYVGVGTDYKIIRGLIKLITDRCAFETSSSVEPAVARQALFFKARSRHPVSDGEEVRRQVIDETAGELGCEPEELIASLYGDLAENQRLVFFEELTPERLLDNYNLAQAQALLYRCLQMRLKVEPQEPSAYRQLFDAIKAYRLIHTIEGSPRTGYDIRLSGPVSMFHRSQKYGVQMAVFLPALLACKGWRLRAEIASKHGSSAFFEISSTDTRLRSDYSVEAIGENTIAERLIAHWAKLASEWKLEPSKEVIDLGVSAFIPDFVIRHPDGRQVYLELLGFWTPRYLGERLKEFERAGFQDFILVASEELRGSRDAPSGLPPNVVTYKTTLGSDVAKEIASKLKLE